jgi:hypothetical protein
LRAAVREICRLDWEKAHPHAALRCLPGLAVILLASLATGRRPDGAIASAAALSVGFGSFHALRRSRGWVMLVVTVAIAVAAFSGSIASRSSWGVLAEIVGWAFLYGLVTALQNGLSWVALQAVIIAVVAAGFPVGPHDALHRAAVTLAGGLLQTGVIVAIWRMLGPPRDEVSGPLVSYKQQSEEGWHRSWHRHAWPSSPVGRFAFQLALTLFLAAVISRWLNLPNGYWVPMTAVILLRPEFHQTLARGLARLTGTLLGVGLATVIAILLRPHGAALAALVVVFAWASYAVLRVNYALFAVCITAYVVFLLAYTGLPEARVVEFRLINTVLGGVLSLGVSLLPLERIFGRGEERVTEAP